MRIHGVEGRVAMWKRVVVGLLEEHNPVVLEKVMDVLEDAIGLLHEDINDFKVRYEVTSI